MALSDEQKKLMNNLYKENDLTKDDIFDSGQYKIITRSGIEKIQYKNEIGVIFKLVHADIDFVVVKAKGKLPIKDEKGAIIGYKTIETFGEWNKHHIKYKKDKTPVPFYSVALAEKRALSRVVLKLMGLYEYGFLGEDETRYKEYDPDDEPNPARIEYLRELLRTSTFDDDYKEMVENTIGNVNAGGVEMEIKKLLMNQKEPDNPNQGDIQESLDKIMEDENQ